MLRPVQARRPALETRHEPYHHVRYLSMNFTVKPMDSDPEFEALKLSTFQLYLEAQERDGFEGEPALQKSMSRQPAGD